MSGTVRTYYGVGDQQYTMGEDGKLYPFDPTNEVTNGPGEDSAAIVQRQIDDYRKSHPSVTLESIQNDPQFWKHDYTSDSFLQGVLKSATVPLMAYGASLLPSVGAAEAVGTSAAPTVGGSGVLSSMGDAVTSYLSKFVDPSFLMTEAGKAMVSNGLQQLVQTGTIDVDSLLDPKKFVKNMAMQGVMGAGSAALGKGISGVTGWTPQVSGQLGTAAMRTALGKNPETSLIGAGLASLDVSPNLAKYATPVIQGLIHGNESGIKNAAINAALEQVQLPDWTSGANTGLSWLDRAVKSGITRGIAGKLRG